MITYAPLKQVLLYDPKTGDFIWVLPPHNHQRLLGKVAGFPDKDGYIIIRVDGRAYKAHRLAWLYMTGEWPVFEIDHKNTNRCANWWDNLRESTRSQNMANCRKFRTNTSGYKGVHYDRRWSHWIAKLNNTYLGSYSSPEEAAKAYASAAKKTYGEFGRAT